MISYFIFVILQKPLAGSSDPICCPQKDFRSFFVQFRGIANEATTVKGIFLGYRPNLAYF